jgi:hypothetical protein
MPILTTEVRWFGPGPVPGDLEAWFASALAGAGLQPERTDAYLRVEADDLSIKLRDGLLEVKGRTAEVYHGALAANVSGRVETWWKWSLSADAAARQLGRVVAPGWDSVPPPAVERGSPWRLVTKRRRTAPLPSAARVPAAGFVELTELTVDGLPHWTFGAEFAAEAEAGVAALRRAAGALRRAGLPRPLPLASSASYPAWLRSAARGASASRPPSG